MIDHRAPPPPSGPVPWDKDFAQRLLSNMVRIRRTEEKSAEMYGADSLVAESRLPGWRQSSERPQRKTGIHGVDDFRLALIEREIPVTTPGANRCAKFLESE
jgi:hypothetical protein